MAAAPSKSPGRPSPRGTTGGSSRPASGTARGRAVRFWLGIVALLALTVAAGLQPLRDDPLRAPTGLTWFTQPVEVNSFARVPAIRSDLRAVFALAQARRVWIGGSAGFLAHSDDEGRSWTRDSVEWGSASSNGDSRITPTPTPTPTPRTPPPSPTPQPSPETNAEGAWWFDALLPPPALAATARPARDSASIPLRTIGSVGSKSDATAEEARRLRAIQNPTPTNRRPVHATTRPTPMPTPRPTATTRSTPSPAMGASDSASAAAVEPTNPVSRPTIQAIDFADETRGWAVGDRGTVLRTVDGGKRWAAVERVTNATLRAVTFLSDGRRGWACGDAIIATQNGGESWSVQSVLRPSDPERLTSIQMASDGRTGWAAGTRSPLWRTVDGTTWTPEDDPRGSGLRVGIKGTLGIQLADDAKHGVASSYNGQTFLTNDGGFSWRLRAESSERFSSGFSYLPAGTAWARSAGRIVAAASYRGRDGGMDGGDLVMSADDGLTWRTSAHVPFVVHAIAWSSDTLRGWLVGADGAVARTLDGGAHWIARSRGALPRLTSVDLSARGDDGYAVGRGAVMATRNGGRTWSTGELPSTIRGVAIDRAGRRAWAVGDSIVVLWRDAKREQSWSIGLAPNARDLRGVRVEGTRGWAWAEGSSASYLATTDGGLSWTQVPSQQMFGNFRLGTDGRTGWVYGVDLPTQATRALRTTPDGGITWSNASPSPGGVQTWFQPGAQHGWSIETTSGGRPVVLGFHETLDGGKSWTSTPPPPSTELRAVGFRDDSVGWMLGVGDTLFVTSDGGHTWAPRATGDDEWINAGQFVDARRGVVVGMSGSIATTQDGGITWQHPQHGHYPAPWLYPLVLLVFFALVRPAMGTAPEESTSMPSVADLLASDRPIRSREDDRLDGVSIAEGVARFLANENTEPPLTIAITGDWGTGKSSIMNLARGALGEYGFRSVWFNAWHHQSEEQLLGSLMESIRRQGLPDWWSLGGLGFRCRLLYIRGIRHWVPAALTLFACAALVAFVFRDKGEHLQPALDALRRLAAFESPADSERGSILALLLSVLTPTLILLRGMTTVGFGPNKVATLLFGGMRVGGGATPVGFRQQFAQTFADITRAMDRRRLVIFIDDLDRCQPTRAVEVLEMVNFLVSSGDCFVIMGMAPQWVQRSIGLGFEKVAEEMADTPAKGQPEKDAREKRRDFARRYLEKLVNIEIPLPAPSDQEARALIVPDLEREARRAQISYRARAKTLDWTRTYAPLAAAAAVIAAGVLWGPPCIDVLQRNYPMRSVTAATTALTRSDATVIGAPTSGMPSATSPTPDTSPEVDRRAFDGTIRVPSTKTVPPWVFPILLGTLLTIGVVRLSSPPRRPERDSDKFRTALDSWYPLVFSVSKTPRSMKRYLNRVRYFAMRQRSEPTREANVSQLLGLPSWMRLRRWFGPTNAATPAPINLAPTEPRAKRIPEDVLVALAAIHHAKEGWLDDDTLWTTVDGTLADRWASVPENIRTRVSELQRNDSLKGYRESFLEMASGIVVRT